MNRRKVKIELRRDTWKVLYVDRKPRQRYSAAGFYKPSTTLEEVKDWVRNNPRLELVE